MKGITYLAGAFILFLAAGCATSRQESTFADQARNTATEWDKGNNLIRSGEAQVKQGEHEQQEAENLMARGKADADKGEGKIQEGKQIIQQLEQEHPEFSQGSR
ncbi:MAG: hypothetical protein HY282_05110 [Nitrospirae bacterium]|nr:hypothetical protein [Candidatus Manganitrophaceae bacterium]